MERDLIKGQRDSLGVPIEPDDYRRQLVAYDWRNTPVYSDNEEEFVLVGGLLIPKNEILDYLLEDDGIIVTVDEISGMGGFL